MAESSSGSDRNLLFGVLALQLDFIKRDELIRAMNAWVLDKSTPLGAILISQNALTAQRQSLLDNLVDEHLRQHGDARKSLRSLPSVHLVKEQSKGITDPEISHTLNTLDPVPPPPSSLDFSTIPHPAPQSPGQRFHPLHPHAQGGLGMVWLARDAELGREVALKEIQAAYADDSDSRNRFVLEAEITGRLEHPGIVPVYSLGQYTNGRPFYAMRFIHGESMDKAAEKFHASPPENRSLALRQLLRRFIDVCNAIGYAHARGVIHRDIKPSNVMLGPYGETLVVDWGLAKPMDRQEELPRPIEGTLRPTLGSDSEQTQPGSVLGTPPYMSPEQASGHLDQIGPHSDIYSLGATLYVLLTGKPPIEGDSVADLLYKARRGEFPSPRAINRLIPQALEAIVLKAMAHTPSQRYATAKELAEDVERWLADEPVKAHREPWHAKVWRWSRRHRTLVTGVGALLLTTIAALSLGLVLLGKKQNETEVQRRRAEDAREEADDNAREAKVQREVALDTLREVVDDVQARLKEWQDRDEPLEGEPLRLLRQQILRGAINGLRRVALAAGSSAEADHNMIRAHLDLGDLLLLDGREEEARKEFEQARRVAQDRLRGSKDDRVVGADLGKALTRLGDAWLQSSRPDQAVAYFQQAIDRISPLVKKDSSNLDAQRALYLAHRRLGKANLQRHRPELAATSFTNAIAVGFDLERLGAAGSRRDVALARAWLGKTRLAGGDASKAIAEMELALESLQVLHKANQTDIQAIRDLVFAYDLLGEAYKKKGDSDGSLIAYRQHRKLSERLAKLARESARGQVDLARSYAKQAQALEEALEYTEAAKEYRLALGVLDKLDMRQKGKTGPETRKWREQLEKQAAFCDQAVKAVGSLAWVLDLSVEQSARMLEVRARVLAKRGKHEDAARTIDELPLKRPGHAPTLIVAACCYARCVEAVTLGKKQTLWTKEDIQQRDTYAGRAVNMLRRASEAGYFNNLNSVVSLGQMKDLDVVREREDYKKLVKDLVLKNRGKP